MHWILFVRVRDYTAITTFTAGLCLAIEEQQGAVLVGAGRCCLRERKYRSFEIVHKGNGKIIMVLLIYMPFFSQLEEFFQSL